MARKSLTAVSALLALGTAVITIVSTASGEEAGRKAADPCQKAWPYNARCKGALAPSDGRGHRLITTNPLSLGKDQPASRRL